MEELKKIVGEENYSEAEKDINLNSTDMTRTPARARCIVFPTSAEQVSEVMKYANREKICVVARGAGTGLVGGAVADSAIVINLRKMDNVADLNLDAKVVTVEPGVILDRLNKELEQHGLEFPVRPSSHMTATLGGMIATNAVGDRAVKYGRTQDNVDKVSIVTGNGDIADVFGERLAIFSGTEGTMGIIVSAKLRLRRTHNDFSMDLFEFDDPDAMMEKVKEVKDDIDVSAIEFMDKILYNLEGFDNEYCLIVEYIGDKGSIKDPAKIEEIWKERDKAYGVLSAHGYKSIEDPWIPFAGRARFLDWLRDKGIPSFGHVGYGIIHPCFETEKTHMLEEMYKVVRSLDGKVSGEHGIGIVKRQWLNDAEKDAHVLLKDHYDKNRILNKDKIVHE